MSRIWSMMDVGKRSMINSQTALQTVSHNIANKSTEGYSRQRVDIQANEPTGMGNLRIGAGARASNVGRINNQFVEKQLEREGAQMGHKEARAESLMRVEQVFNEQLNTGLNKNMAEFFNAYRELSNNPENLAMRNLVKESADFMAKDFKRVNSQLKAIQNEADFRINILVNEVNEIGKEIASLNQKIQAVEISSREASDERDRRDHLLKELSKRVNIKYGESKDGALTVTVGNSALIVSGHTHRELEVANTVAREGKREGNVDIFYKATQSGTPLNITQQIKGGEIGGLLEIRDGFINELHDEMDELAYNLANEVNRAHVAGYDRYNEKGGLFFEPLERVKGASEKLSVSSKILQDPGRVVSAADPNSPADNRIANIISQLQYQRKMASDSSTFDDFYNNMVGKVGVYASRANSEVEAQRDIVGQLKNIRESISGVSLDEETARLIEYQKAFDASARLIRATDEMMDTVLNLKPY